MGKLHVIARIKKVGEKLMAVASDGVKDRDGEVIDPEGWDLKNFKKNPVILWAHKSDSLPIGKAEKISIKKVGNKKQLVFEPKFHTLTEEARTIGKMYEEGILNAFSVGFLPIEADGNKYTKQELLEISAVPVPANPNALVVARQLKKLGLEDAKDILDLKNNKKTMKKEKEIKVKAVIPYSVHGDGPKAPEDAPWDASAEVKKASGDAKKLRKMHAWVDSSAENFDASERKWYKLPHHKGDGEQAVVWRGVAAAMAALMGARGGVQIPDRDRKGVYNHLAKHYKQFDKEVPEFKLVENQVLKDIEFPISPIEEMIKRLEKKLAKISKEISSLEKKIKSSPVARSSDGDRAERPTSQNSSLAEKKKAKVRRLGRSIQNIVSALNSELKEMIENNEK